MTQAPVGPPPTAEIGHAGSFLPPWNYFGALTGGSDPDEPPELRWPQNLRIYNKMRTDAQVDGLIRSVTVPVRNLRWSIDPNGARDEVVQDIAQQLNLPIRGAEGSDTVKRGRKRFNHDEHLRMALLAPTVFGHMPFEIVGWYPEPPEGENLKWKMRKLAPRMPQSLSKIEIARDGGLVSITQWDSTTATPKPIPVQDLVFYAWEKEGAAWTGRSMLRPLYKHWVLKDRLMRIDAIKNERFGAGIPTGTAPPGGDPADYSKMAQAARASESGGIGLPNGAGFAINGVSGSLPDTIGSMRYHDEMMAQSFLAMFMKLGQTQTGSRALGETFVDFFVAGLATFANWYAWITNEHVIEDIVDWNWGPEEQAPLLVWDENENEPLGVTELAKLITSGALVVDVELENWIRAYYGMPEYKGGEPLPTKPANPAQDPGSPADGTPSEPSGSPSAPAAEPASGTPAQAFPGVVHAHGDHDQSTHGHRHTHGETLPTAPAVSSENVTLKDKKTRRARTKFMGKIMGKARYAQVEVEECDGEIVDVVQGASQTLTKPEVGHREPNEIEASAGTDFKKLQQEWQTNTDALVSAWGAVRKQQIDDLITQVEAAVEAGKPEDLATIQAEVRGADTIMKHMLTAAKSAAESAAAEAKKQGVTLDVPDEAALTKMLQPRADAMASLLSRGISDSAARQALLRYGVSALSPAEVGAGVRTQLEALSDSYLNDVLGGAMTQAQNGARREVMSSASNITIYASELLDQNTCENCANEDETEFATQADADEAYPTGGYVDCLGGPRCRGTLVAVYGEGD